MPLPPPAAGSAALITGASSGIGVAIARLLAGRGHAVVLVARREERLRELAAELAEQHGVRAEVVSADLGVPAAREVLAERIGELELEVEVLVNNAGFGTHGSFAELDPGREVELVRLNVEAVVDLTARFVPAMVERGRGAVIQIASTAAFQPMPGGATYAASKAFVLSHGEAIHHELKGSGVTVTTVCPGPVKTEFAEVSDIGEMADSAPEAVWMTPEQIADAAIEAVESEKRAVVPGLLNQATSVLARLAPRGIVLPAVSKLWDR